MRRPSRIARRLPMLLSGGTAGLLTVVVTVCALVSQGYPHRELRLDDASVWVPNESQRLIGHANTEIGSLSTAFPARTSAISLIQDPAHLLVGDASENTLSVASPADAAVSETVPLPPGTSRLVDAGNDLMVYDAATGDVRPIAKDDAASFASTSEPAFSVGADAVLSADANGRYAGYSAKTGMLRVGRLGTGGPVSSAKVPFPGTSRGAQTTIVSGHPVVFDAASAELWLDGRIVSLRGAIGAPQSAVLMQPSVDGDRVLIAHSAGLVGVDLSDGSVHAIGSSVRAVGTPASPVRVAGCDYAAWSGGVAYVLCGQGSGSGRGRDQPTPVPLSSATGHALSLLVNGRRVVANEPASGRTWAVQNGGRLIDNWGDFADSAKTTESEQERQDVPPRVRSEPSPPVAVDDRFGVRAGRANLLPVLVNDSDPNGDPLIVSGVTAVPPGIGRLEVVDDAQKVQLTAAPGATGSATFRYTVDDGHGGTATAAVTVTVVPPSQNGAPIQVRPTRTSVASGGTATVSTLGDWVDPESDPVYLKDATATLPDRVSSTAEGRVEVTDGGTGPGLRSVGLVVSDGSADGAGELSVTVGPAGSVPIIAESFSVTGYAGRDVSVAPLGRVRGGTGTLQLNGVTAPGDSGVHIVPDYANGTFTANADASGTHLLTYTVTDGKQSASAIVRFEARTAPDTAQPPLTRPATAFVQLRDTTEVDVLAGDVDPAGGILTIEDVADVPPCLSAGVVDGRELSVTLLRTLDAGPVTFSYSVSNGTAKALGTVTVIQIPEPLRLRPPVAHPDAVSVRVGSVVDIPVLGNDVQPDGRPLLLAPALVRQLRPGEGTLFAAGDVLRYLAPSKPGTYSAAYGVSTTDGQQATAAVTITVRPIDAANNRPPAPKDVEARVVAGQAVTIPIPLSGTDPDGDEVTVVGQATNPRLGAVTRTSPDSLTYDAGRYSTGTDTFRYTVVDALGAVGTGTIRVGVSAPTGVPVAPVAHDDAVVTRPGTTIHVDVTANDADPQGGALTVRAATSSQGLNPTHDATTVSLTAPMAEGAYAVLYSVQNPRGGQARAWLFLQVARGAPLAGPVAHDIRLGLGDIDGHATVTVDPLETVTFTEGGRSDLALGIPAGFAGARLSGDRVQLDVQKDSRVIPYRVARRDDPSVSAMAFIWVPGTERARPELRTKAPGLTVTSGNILTIPLKDYVIAADDRKVRIADPAGVSATFADGSRLVQDDATLRYVSARDYAGPAGITFTVTDGVPGQAGNQATLTLPITVTPKKDQPPKLDNASVQLETGGETTLDLGVLTEYAYPDKSTLTYAARSASTDVITATIAGSSLRLRASESAAAGASATVVVSPSDRKGPGSPGTITVQIVPSQRPPVSPIDDVVTVRRGASATVDVLANDEATNPFPGRPLRVVAVDASAAPAGVSVRSGADKSTVTVSVGASAPAGTVSIPYSVADVTDDPHRYASARLVIGIQDVPDRPSTAPTVVSTDVDRAEAVLGIPPTHPNNSPITAYRVRPVGKGPTAECAPGTVCVVTGLAHGESYRFTVSAVNALGEGAPSDPSAPIVLDATPGAPAVGIEPDGADRSGGTLDLHWELGRQPGRASAPTGYHVTVTGGGATLLDRDYPLSVTSDRVSGAQPGSLYTIAVTVANATASGPAGTASTTAVAAPVFLPGSVAVQRSGPSGAPTVTWAVGSGAGDVSFSVVRGDPGGACGGGSAADGTSWTDPGAVVDGAVYTVFARNSLFCTAAVTNPLDARQHAAQFQVQLRPQPGADGRERADIYVQAAGLVNVARVEYSLVPFDQRSAGPTTWTELTGSAGFVSGPGTAAADDTRYVVYVRACGSYECTAASRFGDEPQGTPLLPGAVPAPEPPPIEPPSTAEPSPSP